MSALDEMLTVLARAMVLAKTVSAYALPSFGFGLETFHSPLTCCQWKHERFGQGF
jgi:hypothetical protein